MKHIAWVVIAIIVIVGALLLVTGNDNGESVQQEEQQTDGATASGTVTAVDSSQVAVDGPYVVEIETDEGTAQRIEVPSMGINLCAAQENIASVSDIETGDTVSVRGTMSAEGAIVPCEGTDHYLRIES